VQIDRAGLELGNYLSFLVRRQEVVASNIANADTPGYHARDLASPGDFSHALSEAGSGVFEVSDLPAHNDGNNVSIDRESQLLAENNLRFNLATQMLRGELKQLREAIQEGRAA
jgi:flagellar basal-body rod protein FlgB